MQFRGPVVPGPSPAAPSRAQPSEPRTRSYARSGRRNRRLRSNRGEQPRLGYLKRHAGSELQRDVLGAGRACPSKKVQQPASRARVSPVVFVELLLEGAMNGGLQRRSSQTCGGGERGGRIHLPEVAGNRRQECVGQALADFLSRGFGGTPLIESDLERQQGTALP